MHGLAWARMLVGPPDNCPACPCVKTALHGGLLIKTPIITTTMYPIKLSCYFITKSCGRNYLKMRTRHVLSIR